ncbi:hypothetical protein HDE_04152 [Halotydeus destructor]|nr:hypothetical protein HDE_04152 [Halotydeus destructor]
MCKLEEQIAELAKSNKELVGEVRKLREEVNKVVDAIVTNDGNFVIVDDTDDEEEVLVTSSQVVHQCEPLIKRFEFPYTSEIDMKKWLHEKSRDSLIKKQ